MQRLIGLVIAAAIAAWPVPAGADQLGEQIPSNCVAHTSFDGGADLVDDYRCAGLAIEFHTAGVAFSPGPIWAGQWLFVDEAGQFRVGSCTFNRGIHPTIDTPSTRVDQNFPNDPTGAKGAYLTWRYGDTTDDLTAAAMWAVFHFYAQDGAGTRRAADGSTPLVPSLDMISVASGRDDIEALATMLDAEANRFAGEWALTASVGVEGTITAALTSGGVPIADATITLLISGQDDPVSATTDATGVAHGSMPVVGGTLTVVASTTAPGPALVYSGRPAAPDPQGAQRLVTGGPPRSLTVTASVDVPVETTTSTSAATTTVPETTTTTTTSTTVPETTTSTTVPETTTSTTTTVAETSTTSTVPLPGPVEVVPPPVPPDTTVPPVPAAPAPLPRTGHGSDLISYLATAALVAGIGIVGVASRRPSRRVIYTR